MRTLEHEYDFVVVGGGVAGTVAAIAAAREGLKTALVENRPALGGPSGAECSQNSDGSCINGAPEYRNRGAMETGIVEEMRRVAFFRSANGWQQHWSLVMREFVDQEPDLDLYLNTEVFSVEMKGDRIASVKGRTLCSETEHVFRAPLFADCSGDSFVGYSAGAEFRMGREARSEFGESIAPEKADSKTMGSSIGFRAEDMGHPVHFEPPDWAYKITSDDDLPYRMHGNPRKGYWWLEYGGEQDTIHDNETIYRKLLSILFGMWDHVKNGGDHGAENYAITWVSSIPAKRESRRLLGDYVLSQNDLMDHPDFPDAVAYGGWPVDIHPPEGVFGKGHPGTTPPFLFPGAYPIPYRCLYSRNVPNLFMAGRNISVTHVALGSSRVMATCALCAQAVGVAAKLCKEYGIPPRRVGREHFPELLAGLYRGDDILPWMPLMENGEIDRAEASSEMSLKLDAPDGELPLVPVDRDPAIYDPTDTPPEDRRRGQMFPVQPGRLERITVLFANRSGRPVQVKGFLYETASGIPGEFRGREIATAVCTLPAGEKIAGEFAFRAEVKGPSCFFLLEQAEQVSVLTEERHLPGVYCKPDSNYFFRQNFCFEVFPPQKVFAADNVFATIPRPGLTSNCWISDPAQGFPQTLTGFCRTPGKFSAAEVIFDTDLDKKRPVGAAPVCLRDYRVECRSGGAWVLVEEVRGNYRRRRRHVLPQIPVDAIRITALASNGDASARIYNLRVLR